MSAELAWFKSSYSNDQGDACVEVAASWTKSSYSTTDGGDCVEGVASPRTVHVRDSKDQAGPQLAFSPAAWAAFLAFAPEAQAPAVE
ncbi:DUF397 domain-containing protein [Kitasatospora sp. NPDC091207]|uniref:DUF397 domain-containing protein n=1 Tax=Kitasatospora sp. NPDC091207 TaxID=3364083 RepID=UPI00382C097B